MELKIDFIYWAMLTYTILFLIVTTYEIVKSIVDYFLARKRKIKEKEFEEHLESRYLDTAIIRENLIEKNEQEGVK